jgi:hypothetical protein
MNINARSPDSYDGMGSRCACGQGTRVNDVHLVVLTGNSSLPEAAAPGASVTLREVTAMLLDMLLAEGWLRPVGS